MNIDLDVLNKYVKDDLLVVQHHYSYPLSIYNYSRKTQYEGKWDEITLQCRGLIIDRNTGEIIARPFRKFFNIEELEWKVPSGTPKIYAKEDGSLGIVFYYADKWHVATRGSFASEQAERANQMLNEKYSKGSVGLNSLKKEWTYLTEIIYPENRIVLNYNHQSKMILLGAVETSTGIDIDVDTIGFQPFERPYKYSNFGSSTSFKELKQLDTEGEEGFVLRWDDGFRVKIKFENYIKLHAIVTNLTIKSLWELKISGKTDQEIYDMIEVDELVDWAKETLNKWRKRYIVSKKLHTAVYKGISYFSATKKQFALTVQKPIWFRIFGWFGVNYLTSVMFSMRDNREISNHIWKTFKP